MGLTCSKQAARDETKGLQPRELGVGGSGVRIKIDRVGEDHGQEQGAIRGVLARFDTPAE
jgi:hypothetical protein